MTEVAKVYGGALYELCAQTGCEQQLLEELGVLAQVLRENPLFVKLLATPNLPKEERLAIVDRCFQGRVHPYLLHFIKILTENGTVRELEGCGAQYRRRYNEAHNILEVTAVTAVPLSGELEEKLRQKLASSLQKTILLTCRVDPSILGGVRLEMEGVQLEGSLRHKLEALRQNLMQFTL